LFYLFYQKLPNRIYVDTAEKSDFACIKEVKDKHHVTLMMCTACDGSKVPLTVICCNPAKPTCCLLAENHKPPHSHTRIRGGAMLGLIIKLLLGGSRQMYFSPIISPQRRTSFDMSKILLTFITFEMWFYHNLLLFITIMLSVDQNECNIC
jgi:hypothetical protein